MISVVTFRVIIVFQPATSLLSCSYTPIPKLVLVFSSQNVKVRQGEEKSVRGGDQVRGRLISYWLSSASVALATTGPVVVGLVCGPLKTHILPVSHTRTHCLRALILIRLRGVC